MDAKRVKTPAIRKRLVARMKTKKGMALYNRVRREMLRAIIEEEQLNKEHGQRGEN